MPMWSRLAGIAVLLVLPLPLLAETSPAVTETASRDSTADTMSTLVTLGLGLLAVLALIFACAWVLRRMNGLTGMNNQSMKVVSVMALGARERIALIDVAGTQILVGITPTAIRTLHVFDEPVVSPGGKAPSGEFARRLHSLMGRNWKPEQTSAGYRADDTDNKSQNGPGDKL